MTDNTENYSAQILVVDDEPAHADVMAEALQRKGHVCTIVHDLPGALDELKHGTFDVVVTDLVMEREDDGLKVLEAVAQTQPNAETIMVTAHGDVPTAKAALRGGAYDFIEKPLDLEVFRNLVDRAAQTVALRSQNTALKQEVDERYGLEGIVGTSPAIQRVLATIRQVGPSDIPVLVTGESGTGKELVAHAIHQHSPRAKKPFKPLNCAGLSESILESELFGHVRGAFTGAEKDRQGVFEYADGGTLFLDEIGDMPLAMQAKLLRVLESGEVVRVGDNEPRHVDVRLISATNHDLQKLTTEGRFREDLFFRIRGVQVHLPPLRERREDIMPIARHYLQLNAAKMNRPVPQISDGVASALMQHDWPGNVRQLINTVKNMLVLCEGESLETRHLPPEIAQPGEVGGAQSGSLAGMSLDQIEKQAIRNTLRLTAGNREQAAKMLGIGERTLYRKLKEYGVK
jgi:two-component system response regulator HydG